MSSASPRRSGGIRRKGRLVRCIHCFRRRSEHVNERCLFKPTKMKLVTQCSECDKLGVNQEIRWRCACPYGVKLTELGVMFKERTWLTQDGRQLDVTEMSDQHLLNTLAYIGKRCTTLGMKNPHRFMSYDPIVQAPAYPALQLEARKRGLISVLRDGKRVRV